MCQNLNAELKVTLTNINWDTTDGEHPEGQDAGLPQEMTVRTTVDWQRSTLDDILGVAVDQASDDSGWCINGATLKSVEVVHLEEPRAP